MGIDRANPAAHHGGMPKRDWDRLVDALEDSARENAFATVAEEHPEHKGRGDEHPAFHPAYESTLAQLIDTLGSEREYSGLGWGLKKPITRDQHRALVAELLGPKGNPLREQPYLVVRRVGGGEAHTWTLRQGEAFAWEQIFRQSGWSESTPLEYAVVHAGTGGGAVAKVTHWSPLRARPRASMPPMQNNPRRSLLTKEIERKLPKLYSTERIPVDQKVAVVKFFSGSNWTFFGVEYDPKTRLFFGLVIGFDREWGNFSLDELERTGLVERDLYFRPKKIGDLKAGSDYAGYSDNPSSDKVIWAWEGGEWVEHEPGGNEDVFEACDRIEREYGFFCRTGRRDAPPTEAPPEHEIEQTLSDSRAAREARKPVRACPDCGRYGDCYGACKSTRKNPHDDVWMESRGKEYRLQPTGSPHAAEYRVFGMEKCSRCDAPVQYVHRGEGRDLIHGSCGLQLGVLTKGTPWVDEFQPRRNPSHDDEDEDESGTEACPACGGFSGVMGRLGSRTHYMCRDCGAQFSVVDRDEPTENPGGKSQFKIRGPHDAVSEPGEPVWGNGCEMRGCRQPSHGVFILCADGVAREFCSTHAAVVSRKNPAGLTAKGERMYEHVKESYGSDPRAKEIAARTVYARAGEGATGLRNNPTHEATTREGRLFEQIINGMERTLWVAAYMSFVDEETMEGRGEGLPKPGGGENWDDYAPETPETATDAASTLIRIFEKLNQKDLLALLYLAAKADRISKGAITDDYAEEFGSDLAMMGLGTGVSWFDDHKTFPLKHPLHFEAWTSDGETLEHSGRA